MNFGGGFEGRESKEKEGNEEEKSTDVNGGLSFG